MLPLLLALTWLSASVAADPEPVSRSVDYEVSVSPDGERLAFVSDRGGRFKLYIMNDDGSGVLQLTNGDGADENPSWSPDGTQIAFVSESNGEADIHVIAADGAWRRQVTRAPGSDLHPAWSADGRRLLFTSLRNSPSPDRPQLDIYVIDADGTNEQRLTSGPITSYASWSRDGNHMAFWRMFGDNADISIADGTGQNIRRLTVDPAFDGWPAWSPDGRHIAFARERSDEADIYVIDLGGREQLVAGGPGRKTGPQWSPDGRYIYFARRHERQTRIWRVASPVYRTAD